MERTFAIIKPDAVSRRLAGQILARIEAAGFTVRAMRLQHLSKKEAEGFYAVHKERPFFGELTDFMSSGPCVLLCLEAPDAIKKWRDTMGPTDPAKAEPGHAAPRLRPVDRQQRHPRFRRAGDGRVRTGVFLPRHGAVVGVGLRALGHEAARVCPWDESLILGGLVMAWPDSR